MRTTGRKSFAAEALKQGLLIVSIAAAISLLVNHFRQNGLPLRATPSAKTASADSGEPLQVSLEEARALFFAHAAVFIDARSGEDYRAGHIRGAVSLPEQNLDQALPAVASKLSSGSLLIAYCDGEHCSLSREVALQLLAKGYSHAAVLLNGWTLWCNAGLPTGKGP
ncbi:MAG: rhodanese-like domain-containing protein [Syntrophobacteraceae bacterium]